MYRLYGTHRWWFCAYEIIHFQVFIRTCRLFYFAFYGWTSNIDALTKLQYALWNKGPYTMSIVFTYLLHNTVRPAMSDKKCPYTKAMSPLAILGSMLSRFMSPHPILERLPTTFVWLCWCKSRRLGVWNFTLCWGTNTNSYLCPFFWVTKSHVNCGNNLLH